MLNQKFKYLIPTELFEWFDLGCVKFNITETVAQAHLLSQVMHESLEFKFRVENLNYTREGLLKNFPKYFNEDNVMNYVKNPKAIASRVYANRMGNGNETSGDGWKFKGRGFIQLTGKNNYKKISKDLNEDFINNPELLITDKYACLSACWYFYPITKKLGKMSVNDVTKYVNGGLIGLEDRLNRFNKIIQWIK